MDLHLQETWDQLLKGVSREQNTEALTLGAYLILGGLMAIYIRFLYRQCGSSPNDAETITRVFPLLTLVTIGVIAVVKSSMALSLGLVGALSIVRFRAAIKEPEELVYLFLCIGVGLALGANQPLLAVMLLVVASIFIWGMHKAQDGKRMQNLLLTISGDAEKYFSKNGPSALNAIEEMTRGYTLQRMDVENGRGQVRIVLHSADSQFTVAMMQHLRDRMPDCEISYVNLTNTW